MLIRIWPGVRVVRTNYVPCEGARPAAAADQEPGGGASSPPLQAAQESPAQGAHRAHHLPRSGKHSEHTIYLAQVP